jgi:hypothetical protein
MKIRSSTSAATAVTGGTSPSPTRPCSFCEAGFRPSRCCQNARPRAATPLFLLLTFCAAPHLSAAAAETPGRAILFPRLAAGQSFTYEIGYRASTNTDTESSVAAPMAPAGGQSEAHLLLEVAVEEAGSEEGKPTARLRTRLLDPNSSAAATSVPAASEASNGAAPAGKVVEFTLHADGQVTDVRGLEALSADERAAWQEWLARFGVGAAIPEKALKPGEKWRVEEPITTALITGLSWDKESQYVDDEPCSVALASPATPANPGSAATNGSPESCAVILTTATLKQKNPQKDATPDDYRLHDLRTYGVAKGTNEIISYISLKTGLIVRATEDANQSLNVIVAKSDGSNRVHYIIDAQSHTQVLLKSAPAQP